MEQKSDSRVVSGELEEHPGLARGWFQYKFPALSRGLTKQGGTFYAYYE
jgi:hypothetical protein